MDTFTKAALALIALTAGGVTAAGTVGFGAHYLWKTNFSTTYQIQHSGAASLLYQPQLACAENTIFKPGTQFTTPNGGHVAITSATCGILPQTTPVVGLEYTTPGGHERDFVIRPNGTGNPSLRSI